MTLKQFINTIPPTKKPLVIDKRLFLFGSSGERGIRTPGPVTVNGFQDRRIRPLCHLSAAKVSVRRLMAKFMFYFFTIIF